MNMLSLVVCVEGRLLSFLCVIRTLHCVTVGKVGRSSSSWHLGLKKPTLNLELLLVPYESSDLMDVGEHGGFRYADAVPAP